MKMQKLFGLRKAPLDTGSIVEAQHSISSLPEQAASANVPRRKPGPPVPPKPEFLRMHNHPPKTDTQNEVPGYTEDESPVIVAQSVHTDDTSLDTRALNASLGLAAQDFLARSSNAGGSTTPLGKVARTSKSVFKRMASSLQNAFTNGLLVKGNRPGFMVHTIDNIEDCAKLQKGEPGVCSACAKIPLDECFTGLSSDNCKSIAWTTHLARVVQHSDWCVFCRILVDMLSRPEHDPVLNPHVQPYIKDSKLRNVPFAGWVSKKHFNLHANWPFGHKTGLKGDDINYVTLSQWGVFFGRATLFILLNLPVLAIAVLNAATGGQGMATMAKLSYTPPPQKWPLTVHVVVDIAMVQADEPALLTVRLVGHNGADKPVKAILSEFKLRAVRQDSTVAVHPDRPLSYARVLDVHAIDLSMAKLWLSECEDKHGSMCSEHGWAAVMTAPESLRFIDVRDSCLVSMQTANLPRFIALSYVWGRAQSQTLRLQHSNLRDLYLPGSLRRRARDIPRTVGDEIEIVRAVSERYLWVDALCIIQDSSEESKDQISKMDQIYGAALFTIVAASGKTAKAGIPGIMRQSDIPGEMTSTPRQVLQPSARMGEAVSVVAPYYRTEDDDVAKTAWATRAWTFQERLLSKRMLIFTSNEMTWHCPKMIYKEDMPIDHSEGFQSSLSWLSLKPRHFGIGAPNWHDGSLDHTSHDSTHLVRSETFAEYVSIIQQYSQRSMTFPSDKINALAGLLRIFSLAFRCECLAGVPTGLLDAALLWRRAGGSLKRLPPNLGFPTWSWAGWEGEVAYGAPVRVKKSSYANKAIEVEGIRPLLRYFVYNESRGLLQPLNLSLLGTARGIPLRDADLPQEWEAYHTGSDASDPQLHNLSPPLLQRISPTQLFFYTNVVSNFTLASIAGQPPELFQAPFVMLDQHAEYQEIVFGGAYVNLQLIVVAEATGSLLVPSSELFDYDWYLVMLVEVDDVSGISRRLGLGTVPKILWYSADCKQTLICLG